MISPRKTMVTVPLATTSSTWRPMWDIGTE